MLKGFLNDHEQVVKAFHWLTMPSLSGVFIPGVKDNYETFSTSYRNVKIQIVLGTTENFWMLNISICTAMVYLRVVENKDKKQNSSSLMSFNDDG